MPRITTSQLFERYSHGIAIAGGRAEELMITLDAGHALDHIAPDIQAERHRQRRPPDLERGGRERGTGISIGNVRPIK